MTEEDEAARQIAVEAALLVDEAELGLRREALRDAQVDYTACVVRLSDEGIRIVWEALRRAADALRGYDRNAADAIEAAAALTASVIFANDGVERLHAAGLGLFESPP